MAKNEVFANDREVACKVASGKSTCCFPDMCHAPPKGDPLPFPNTAYAKDLQKGSRSVLITGKPVAKRDVSYFSTSTCNEPATEAFPKGVVTHTLTGKAYFASWSMDVKIEKKNVCRHIDTMTHNHASKPGNTGPWKYFDEATKKGKCEGEEEKINEACCGDATVRDCDWKSEHCMDLSDYPYQSKKFLDAQKNLDTTVGNMQELAKQLAEMLDLDPTEIAAEMAATQAEKVFDKIKDKISQRATQSVGRSAVAKGGAKVVGRVALKFVPIIGWASLAYDAYSVAKWAMETGPEDLLEDLEKIKKYKQGLMKKLDYAKEVEHMPDLVQHGKDNECLKARRCLLSPYQPSACCPNQTGHHLIPKASFKHKVPVSPNARARSRGRAKPKVESIPGWEKYNQARAPVVCVEGTGHSTPRSTHAKIHEKYNKVFEKKAKGAKVSYEKASKAAVDSHQDVFGSSECAPECLEAQLDAYHNDAFKPTPKNPSKQVSVTKAGKGSGDPKPQETRRKRGRGRR